MQLKACKLICK